MARDNRCMLLHHDTQPRPSHELDGGRTEYELTAGDLLFMQSPGSVQRLVESARDRFRHTAIVVRLGGHLWVVEAGRAGYRGRPLTTVLDRYDEVHAMRLTGCRAGCPDRVVSAALAAMEDPTHYPGRTDLAIAGLLSYSRTYLRRERSLARSAVHAVASRRVGLAAGQRPSLCASLVVEAVSATCPLHRPVIDLRRPKEATVVDPDPLARDYALPDDLWRAMTSSVTTSLPPTVVTWQVRRSGEAGRPRVDEFASGTGDLANRR